MNAMCVNFVLYIQFWCICVLSSCEVYCALGLKKKFKKND